MEKPEEQLFILRPGDDNAENVLSNLLAFIMLWRDKHPIEVVVRAFKMKRSDLQNRYLHGWIFRKQLATKLFNAGITAEEGAEFTVPRLKILFKHPFFADQIVEPVYFKVNGVEYREEFHPSDLPRDKFAKYCDLICWAAAERWGIEVEPPMSGHWRQIYEELKMSKEK